MMSNAVAAAPAALHVSHILAPVDFSDACSRSVARAAAIARHFSANLTLLHAVPIAPVAYAIPEALAYAPSEAVAARQVAERAARLDTILREPGAPPAGRVVLEDEPARAILDYAAGHQSDLIVMPTHGYSALQRLLLGSITAEVLRSAPCPVWSGAHPEASAPDTVAAVLCALDLEPHSPAVLAWAAAFARSYGASLEIVHVLPMSAVRAGGVYFDPEWHIDVARDARSRIEDILHRAAVEAKVTIELGDVPGAIVGRTREVHADVLVIGRGPHCYSIVRESPGAVVVV